LVDGSGESAVAGGWRLIPNTTDTIERATRKKRLVPLSAGYGLESCAVGLDVGFDCKRYTR
jgi:hypothetical protein